MNSVSCVVVVSGPPASGKTTLASRLASDFSLPLITKDGIKEALFDSCGTGDREWSQRLGRAAFALIWHFLETVLAAGQSAIVEGNFHADYGSREFDRLAERFDFATLQIHCWAPVDVLYTRYEVRADSRHIGHVDKERLADIRELLDSDRYLLRLPGELIMLESTSSSGADYEAAHVAVERLLATAGR